MSAHEPFSDTPHDHAAEIAKQKAGERRQLALDYAATFSGTRGQKVLNDLKKLFGFNRASALPGMKSKHVWHREGMKLPLWHIEQQVALGKAGGRRARPTRADKHASHEITPEIPPELQ